MAKFYFTYGIDSDTQPYRGGWTEVEADDEMQARHIFGLVHRTKDGYLACSSVYDEQLFAKTIMAKSGENFGRGCVERIAIKVDVLDRGALNV